jgi:hypothetical protein
VEEMMHLQITEEITKEENNPLQITEEINKEENNPLTPSCLAMILNNLFRKESNGDPIEFYMRRTRFCHHENNLELEGKCSKLKEQIEVRFTHDRYYSSFQGIHFLFTYCCLEMRREFRGDAA